MKTCTYFIFAIATIVYTTNSLASVTNTLSLEEALLVAIKNDPWLKGSKHRERAILSNSRASLSLPDPVVSIGIANLPTNGFSFNQEAMTQLKAGVSQMFARGDSLQIRSKQLVQLAEQHPFMRQDRQAKTQVAVTYAWLEVFRAQQAINLIQQDRALFEQLGDVAQASYSSAIGKVRQQDIVRAQLELTRLDDRVTQLYAQKEQASAQLSEWFFDEQQFTLLPKAVTQSFHLPAKVPDIASLPTKMEVNLNKHNTPELAQLLSLHPAIMAIEKNISASQTGIELAKQQYKPQWSVNASYAYRADDRLNNSRADFMSLGVSFDLPLFTESKQDQDVSAAISQAEAMKTDKLLAIRAMLAQLQSAYAIYNRLRQRQSLYAENILPQMSDQAEASLTAYTNDDGDFAEVVRARIADLNARIDALNIQVDLLKSQAQLNYFTAVANDANADTYGDKK